MEIVLKTISGAFNPVQLTFTRFLLGGLVLLPLALRELKKRGLHVTLRDLLPFAGIGFVGVTISMTLYQLAVMYTEASVVAVLFSSNPLFVMLFAYLLLREPIFKRNILALALDLVGIFCVINPLHLKLSMAGVTLTMLSTLLFALYGVAGKKKSGIYGGVVNTCFGFLFGSAEMVLLALITHVPAIATALSHTGLKSFAAVPFFSGYSLSVLPQFLYVCIGVTGIGYASYFLAMEYTSANTASLVFFFKPILAPILALLFLQETIPVNRWIGIVFILAGSLTNLLPPLLAARRGILSTNAGDGGRKADKKQERGVQDARGDDACLQ
jgi:drug/metabolite transporter (DMT)-like permease